LQANEQDQKPNEEELVAIQIHWNADRREDALTWQRQELEGAERLTHCVYRSVASLDFKRWSGIAVMPIMPSLPTHGNERERNLTLCGLRRLLQAERPFRRWRSRCNPVN
jgi:hypothetical protein